MLLLRCGRPLQQQAQGDKGVSLSTQRLEAAVGMNESESDAGSNALLSWLGCELYNESLLARCELAHPTC